MEDVTIRGIKRMICLLFIVPVSARVQHDFESVERRSACGVNDPLTALPWLNALKVSLQKSVGSGTYPFFYLVQGELNGVTVFVIENCCPFCGTERLAYHCKRRK